MKNCFFALYQTKSGAHKQLTFYFQMWKYFCRHLHSSLISMVNVNGKGICQTSYDVRYHERDHYDLRYIFVAKAPHL